MRLKRLLFGILLPAILVAALAACSANTGSLKVRDVFETSKHITLGQYKGIKTDLEALKEMAPEDIERSKYSVLIKTLSSHTNRNLPPKNGIRYTFIIMPQATAM